MPVFPSKEWCEEAAAALNADPESARAGKGFTGEIAAAVLPEPPDLRDGFAIWVRPEGGRIAELRVLEDLDEIEEIEPAYVARATYATWKGLLLGSLDPIEAVLQHKIDFRGDLRQLVERAQYKDLIRRVLSRVPTTFKDAVP
jgi:hypothetical protein